MLKIINFSNFYKSTIFIILFFSIIAFISTLPIFRNFDNWGIQDWDENVFYSAVARDTVLEYHQFPLWNPYSCGGTVLLANPLSRFLSPTSILILIFDVVRGVKIEIWLHLVMGMLGVYLLAQHYKLGIASGVISSFVFMLSSMFAINITVGMMWFLSVAYLPWVFLFYLKAFHNSSYAFIGGFFLALMFFDGGPYPLGITLLFLIIYSFLLICLRNFKTTRVIKIMCIILIYMLCLGAIKFFPFIEFGYKHPRLISDYSGFSLHSLLCSFFGRDQTIAAADKLSGEKLGFIDGISYNMDENGMYVGIIPFLLFLIAIRFHHKRRICLALSFLIFLWISFGNRIPISLWEIIHKFPIYSSMRVAQRFRIVVMLNLALFVGLGFRTVRDYVFRLISNKFLRQLFILGSIFAILADFMIVVSPVWRDAFTRPPLRTVKSDRFYQVSESLPYDKNAWLYTPANDAFEPWKSLYVAFLSNVGIINDVSQTADLPMHALPVDSEHYKGEVYFLGKEGEARLTRWSPNKFVISIKAQDDGYVVLNQNYYSGWRAKGSKKYNVESINGLLAVKIPHQEKKIVLYYLPTTFIIGLIVTLITFLFSIIFLFFRKASK